MNYFIFVLFIAFYCATVLADDVQDDHKEIYHCYNLAWIPGWGEGEMLNCSEADGVPCVDEVIGSMDPPDFVDLWNNHGNNYRCVLRDGFSCIKYTNSLNGAILTSVHFCGKMIEEKVGIKEGCYTQTKDGYDTEYCACQTSYSANKMPCNSAVGNISSLLGIILLTITCIY